MKMNMKEAKSGAEALPMSAEKKPKVSSPYLSKGIYNNYAKGMKEKNQKRVGQGLKALRVRTFEEWAGE